MSQREYTRQDVINQSLVAFGQGTQFMRVSAQACSVVTSVMNAVDEHQKLHATWGTIAVQVLERIRTAGRLAAARAVDDARTFISEEDVEVALRRVRATSKSGQCGSDGGDDDGSGDGSGGGAGQAGGASWPP
ncbi:MAG: hypothetical protein AAGE94_02620 [Acidobacteriota bacterium]